MLRTLITDVTLTSSPAGDQIRADICWRSGACEERVAARARMRTGQETVELIRRRKLAGLHDTESLLYSALSDCGPRGAASSERGMCATSATPSAWHALLAHRESGYDLQFQRRQERLAVP